MTGVPWLREDGDALILALHVQPGAKRTEVGGVHGEALKLRLAAPPVDGKANAALLRFLADAFGVPLSRVTLERGKASRDKHVRIESPGRRPPWLAWADPALAPGAPRVARGSRPLQAGPRAFGPRESASLASSPRTVRPPLVRRPLCHSRLARLLRRRRTTARTRSLGHFVVNKRALSASCATPARLRFRRDLEQEGPPFRIVKMLSRILHPMRWLARVPGAPGAPVAGTGGALYFYGQRNESIPTSPPPSSKSRMTGSPEPETLERLRALVESEARFRSLTSLASDWHWDQDAQFRTVAVSGNPSDPIGTLIGQNLGKPLWHIATIATLEGSWTDFHRALRKQETFRDVILRAPRPEGGYSYVSISGEPVFDAEGAFAGYRGVALDITKQKLIEANISRLARFDPLTGLRNRTAFFERLDHAIAAARRHHRVVALLFVDLDRFKDVNDAFGHLSGDAVLKALTMRLTATVRGSDTIARLGGDEFVVLAEDVANQVDVNELGLRILQSLSEPVVMQRPGVPASARASASRSSRTTARTPRRSSRMPMARCTGPRRRAERLRVLSPPRCRSVRHRSGSRCARALRSALERERAACCSIQPKVAIDVPASSPASRRWSAGSIPSTGG